MDLVNISVENKNELSTSNANFDKYFPVLDESEEKELKERNTSQYEMLAKNFRKKTLENFLYPKDERNPSELDDLAYNYKKLFFDDFEKQNFLQQINFNSKDFLSSNNNNGSNSINNRSKKSEEAEKENDKNKFSANVKNKNEFNNQKNKEFKLLQFYEDSIKKINEELLTNPDIAIKHNKNIELYSKLEKLNIIQANFLDCNAIEEIPVPKKNLTLFEFRSENARDRVLLKHPLDSLILQKPKDFNDANANSINDISEFESKKEKENSQNYNINNNNYSNYYFYSHYFYNFAFKANGALEFLETRLELEDLSKSPNNAFTSNNEKDLLSKLRKSARASVMLFRKSTNVSKLQKSLAANLNNNTNTNNNNTINNLNNDATEGFKKLKFFARKLYNDKGFISYDIRFNFREEFLEKHFRENLENQDEIDFIKLIDYKNGNKINFLEKINLKKNKFLKNSSGDFLGNLKLNCAVNIRSLDKRAEVLVESRVKPVNNTLKRIFKVLANVKKQVECNREKKNNFEKETKIKNKKSMLQNFNLTKKLSYIGDDLANNLSSYAVNNNQNKNSSNKNINNFKKDDESNNSQNSFVINEQSEFDLNTFDSAESNNNNKKDNFNNNYDNREKENISFGKDENKIESQHASMFKSRKTIGISGKANFINHENENVNETETENAFYANNNFNKKEENSNKKILNENKGFVNENKDWISNLNYEDKEISEVKAKQYDNKLKMLLAKNKNRNYEANDNQNKEKLEKDFNRKGADKDERSNRNENFRELINDPKAISDIAQASNQYNNFSNNLISKQKDNETLSIPRDINIPALKNFIRQDINRRNNMNK